VAVVIGGTGVLGGALAEGLASAGAAVAVVGRNAERGLARVAAIEKAGGSGWREYLKTFEQGMGGINQQKLAAQALEMYQKNPKKFIALIGGNDTKVTTGLVSLLSLESGGTALLLSDVRAVVGVLT
jgi:NAD(P)-dependent dehydrogenase (short-subunit alcohol dehydrogenase family)